MSQQYDSLPQLVAKFINNTSQNIFLTGKAGTGKTTFLRNIKNHTHKSVIVAAPTGIAAINAGGVTLHSLFQLPFGAFVPDNNGLANQTINTQVNTPRTLLSSFQMHKTKRNMLKKMELLIIDEVSMLRSDLLDAIDLILRSVRRQRDEPFGGVQVLFIGDLLQLPPVVKDDEWRVIGAYYPSAFFFHSQVLRQMPPLYVELEKIYRQSDNTFIGLLNNLRNNVMTDADAQLLNKFYKPNYQQKSDEGVILLTTHNRIANDKNLKALQSIKEKSVYFKAEVIGDFKEYSYPIEPQLEFKKGAQVMFTKNDYSGQQKYFNGKIGTITRLHKDEIEVSFNNGDEPAIAEPYIWENKKYSIDKDSNEIEESIVGTFKQYPLKLAWAITVHKSQGLTFDKAIIDVQNAFAPGQIYVALSRLRSLDGLILTSPVPKEGFQVDPSLKTFSTLKKKQAELEPILQQESRKYFNSFVMRAFDFSGLMQDLSFHVSSYTKDAKRSVKQQYHFKALEWMKASEPLRTVADSFRAEVNRIVNSGHANYLPHLHERVSRAAGYFEPLIKAIHDNIRDLCAELKGVKGAKAYHTELVDLSNLFYGQLQVIYKAQSLINTAIDGTDFDRNAIRKPDFAESRDNLNPNKKKKLPKDKKEKADTKLVSYEMYKDGKNIQAIAKERSLTEGTVEGHLAHYVQLGELDALDFIGQGKLAMIEKVIHKLDTFALTPLKKELGNGFSYGELRLGVAYMISQRKD
ncbi:MULTISPECIES: helix-turn-helix domain-containing protein [unclassified Saccharicrinis]|uniref:helix-turn-helix domain-containing protein n=1 Tax=unclassified Saccharicrinis TaxID=2646859 RepID=UPI003D34CA54